MDLISALWPDTAATTAQGRLSIAGCDTAELVAKYGTPLYLLDEATLRATATTFTGALERHYPAPATVHYAGKALLNTAVAQLMARYGLGLDCVSIGELSVARHAGVDLAAVHLHGNAKPGRELATALEWGIGRVVVDSLDELETLGELARDRREPQAVLLRLNPGIDVHTHAHVQTGQLDSKFGLPIATGMAEAAVRRALEMPGLRLAGLHMHLGSQIVELAPLRRAIHELFSFAAAMRDRLDWTLEEVSPGGGMGVAYRPGDPAPEVAEYVRLLAEA
ncbi:MAG TPA: alanine racemase, partial [Herpetosiphonaceae bacterium]|nr:alanine racemase [Herpetosiphonaceae bacterium]